MQIFRDQQHKTVECYVDHLADLRGVFKILRKHNMRMNPLKCFLAVVTGKFLGFLITRDGITVDPVKTKAILEMKPPTNLRELKRLQGHLAYIRRFISNLSGRCQPFSRLMKKGIEKVWDQACDNAFQSIK